MDNMTLAESSSLQPEQRTTAYLTTGLCTLLFALLIYSWWTKEGRAARSKLQKLPGPSLRKWYQGGPLIGHLPEMLRLKYFRAHAQWTQEYGPVVKYHPGPRVAVLISDPELVRIIGLKNHRIFHDRVMPGNVRKNDTKGLVLASGTYWESVRREVMPLFQTSQLAKFGGIMHGKASVLVKRLQAVPDGATVNMLDWLQAMTLDVIGSTAFGIEFDMQSGGKQTEFLEAMVRQVAGPPGGPRLAFVLTMLLPAVGGPLMKLLSLIPGTEDYKQRKQRNFVFSECERIIAERRKDPSANEKYDFLTLLTKTRLKDTGRALLDSEIRQLVFEFLIAGSETTANTVAFAIYLLSQHPDKAAKMVDEITRVTDELSHEPGDYPKPSYEELKRFPYVEQVIQEAMRVYPTAAMVTRSPLEDVEVGGYQLPKGCSVTFPVWAMHRNPKNFPEPEVFKPERWEPEEGKDRHPYAYIPFGLGPRMCPGFRFAMEEAKLALIQLYKNFTFNVDKEKMGEGELDISASIVLKPKPGMFVSVHPRAPREVPAGA